MILRRKPHKCINIGGFWMNKKYERDKQPYIECVKLHYPWVGIGCELLK